MPSIHAANTLLRVQQLVIASREKTLVNGVSFALDAGQTLAIVGESGSGKSLSLLAVMGLLAPTLQQSGSIMLGDQSLSELHGQPDHPLWRQVRGKRIAMIFQEPMTALNPLHTVEQQVGESLRLSGLSKADTRQKVLSLLTQVGIPEPERRLKQYPHELSGGQRQRVMIAMALALDPEILIADEPTTALDVTLQAQILDLLDSLKRRAADGADLDQSRSQFGAPL
jgi:microcin C transport system ATP-binding protein